MTRILIKNGKIVDGTGSDAFSADVLLEGGKILEVDSLKDVEADVVVDAKGKVVSPGFIDMHSHADLSLPIAPFAESLAHQGITTVVAGQCGISPSPAQIILSGMPWP